MDPSQPSAAPTEVVVHLNAYFPSEALMDVARLAFRADATLLELAHGQHPGTYFATLSGTAGLEERITQHASECTNLEVVTETGPTTPRWRAVTPAPADGTRT